MKKNALSALGKTMLGIITAVALNACAGGQSAPPDTSYGAYTPDDGEIAGVVLAGMRGISERYIDEIPAGKLGTDALRGLGAIDPDIVVSTGDGAITISSEPLAAGSANGANTGVIAGFAAPEPGDMTGWHNTVLAGLQAARRGSSLVAASDDEKILEALFDGMLSGLDIHSRYAGREEASRNREKRNGYGGIGVETRLAANPHDETGAEITRVFPDSPAARAGLVAGDVIVGIAGRPVTGMSARKIMSLLHGPEGSSLDLLARIGGIDGVEKLFHVKRSHVIAETARARLDGTLLVMEISGFNKNTSSSVRAHLENYRHAITAGGITGVVLDVRGNPGGLLLESVNLADLFLEDGDIITTRGRHPESLNHYRAGGIDHAHGLPMAVLVDGDSASAAEVLAAALQDQGRAVVVGYGSYGKGSVQTVLMLPNAGEITLTWSGIFAPSGYAINGRGIMPDACAAHKEKAIDGASLSESASVLREWRKTPADRHKVLARLKGTCPDNGAKDGADNDADRVIDMARGILANAHLYAIVTQTGMPVDSASLENR